MSFEGWDEVKLGELIESVSVTHSLNDDKVIFLNTSDILEGKVLHHTYSPVKGLPGQAKKSIKKHDILFSEIRPANKRFAYIDFDADDYVVSTKLMVLRRISGRINNRFLYHILTSREMLDYLQGVAEARSGTFPQITFNELRKIKISLPPYDEQVGICNVIESIQGKIELNNAINKNLEEMTQALFKRWFVDFEFPNENGEPYKSSGGGEFEESELGLIPKGWKVGRATDIFDVQSGGTPKTSTFEYWNGEISFFTPKDCSNSLYVIETEKTITEDGLNNCNSKLFKTDTVFITARGTVGKVALAGRDMAMNQSCYALVAKSGYTQKYVFHLTQQLVNVLRKNASGAVFDAITVSTFQNLKTTLPDIELVRHFDGLVNGLYSLLLEKANETQTLQQLRDTLLPKLMSGEIRVPVEQDHSAPDLPMVAERSANYQP